MPAVVLGLLGGHMIFIFTAITLGTGDPSFAVVPDYYEKAVDYDERKALLAQSARLGWSVRLLPGHEADAVGLRELVVQVRDAEGEPLSGLNVRIYAYHQARASDPIAFECLELLPGQYVGQAKMSREGFWQFAIEASSGEQRFVADQKQFVKAPEAIK